MGVTRRKQLTIESRMETSIEPRKYAPVDSHPSMPGQLAGTIDDLPGRICRAITAIIWQCQGPPSTAVSHVSAEAMAAPACFAPATCTHRAHHGSHGEGLCTGPTKRPKKMRGARCAVPQYEPGACCTPAPRRRRPPPRGRPPLGTPPRPPSRPSWRRRRWCRRTAPRGTFAAP